jgi:hypothetical protein
MDDENTLSITWTLSRVPKEREPYVQDRIPTWQGPIADENTGRWITSHVMNQDFVTWVGQGRIADRSYILARAIAASSWYAAASCATSTQSQGEKTQRR